MKLPNLNGYHNSHDGVIPTLISVIEQQNHEINTLRMELRILRETALDTDKRLNALVKGLASLKGDE